MRCNLNIEILFKYYPCTFNTLLLKVWWNQKLGATCANQKMHTPIPSVTGFYIIIVTFYTIIVLYAFYMGTSTAWSEENDIIYQVVVEAVLCFEK